MPRRGAKMVTCWYNDPASSLLPAGATRDWPQDPKPRPPHACLKYPAFAARCLNAVPGDGSQDPPASLTWPATYRPVAPAGSVQRVLAGPKEDDRRQPFHRHAVLAALVATHEPVGSLCAAMTCPMPGELTLMADVRSSPCRTFGQGRSGCVNPFRTGESIRACLHPGPAWPWRRIPPKGSRQARDDSQSGKGACSPRRPLVTSGSGEPGETTGHDEPSGCGLSWRDSESGPRLSHMNP